MNRAVIYTRISKDAEKRGEGVDRQRADCEGLANRLGVTVAAVYEDNDIGASTKSRKRARPGFDAMVAAVEAGEVDVIVAYSNSRLTRRPMEFETLIQLHERTGVRISTVASGEDDLSTADGRMVARIKASVDAAESERISERTRRAKGERKKSGLPQDGRARYGYNRVWSDKGKVEAYAPDEEGGTADVLRGLYRDYLDGAGLAALCRSLSDRGVRSPAGKDWSTQTLSHVLCSGFAAGVIRELATGEEHPGAHEALITPAEWQRFKDTRAAKAGTWREVPRARRGWVLAGIAKCGLCGKNLVQNRSRKGKDAQVLCSHYNSTRSCAGVWLKTKRLEDAVWDCLSNVIPDQWEQAPGASAGDAELASAEARRAEAEAGRLTSLLAKLERRRTEDEISTEAYRSVRAEYEAERTAAEESARAARAQATEASKADVDWESLVERHQEDPDAVQTALQRETLKRVLSRVEVHPTAISVVPVRGPRVTYQR